MVRLVSTTLVTLAIAACATPSVEPGPTAPSNGEAVTVELVVDGDTFRDIGGTTFRLDGINAPESDECFYMEAVEGLAQLVEGTTVQVTRTGTDQFGRDLAQVSTGGEWVNLRMVTDGMALATTPEDDEGTRLVAAEEEAFADRVGLWAPDACGGNGALPHLAFDPDAGEVNPPGPDETTLSQESVVIVNHGQVAVNLSGWSIRDESSRHRFAFRDGAVIRPGERMIVSSDDQGWDPGASPVWNNGGDLALLIDPSGHIVDRFRY